MAKSFYLSNPKVTVNSVDLQDQTTAATLTLRFPPQRTTTFGDTAETYGAGLGDHELTLTLFMSYEASETYATLKDLVGATTTVRVQPTSAVDSATNPGFILTGTYLAELPVLNAQLGELSSIDVTFQGGSYSTDTTNP
jgi:hypothetical protein